MEASLALTALHRPATAFLGQPVRHGAAAVAGARRRGRGGAGCASRAAQACRAARGGLLARAARFPVCLRPQRRATGRAAAAAAAPLRDAPPAVGHRRVGTARRQAARRRAERGGGGAARTRRALGARRAARRYLRAPRQLRSGWRAAAHQAAAHCRARRALLSASSAARRAARCWRARHLGGRPRRWAAARGTRGGGRRGWRAGATAPAGGVANSRWAVALACARRQAARGLPATLVALPGKAV